MGRLQFLEYMYLICSISSQGEWEDGIACALEDFVFADTREG